MGHTHRCCQSENSGSVKGSTDINISKPTGLESYRTVSCIFPSTPPKIYVGDNEGKTPHILTGPLYVSDVLFSYLLDWWLPSLSSESLPNTIYFRSPDNSGACQLTCLNFAQSFYVRLSVTLLVQRDCIYCIPCRSTRTSPRRSLLSKCHPVS
jgi:hypothetical protein